jgi:hypothetical protein
MLRKSNSLGGIGIALAVGLFVVSASPAYAAPAIEVTSTTADTAAELFDAMSSSSIPRTTTEVAGATLTTFHSTSGPAPMDLTFGVPGASTGAGAHTNLAGGWDGQGPYILLNTFDQDAVISGGGFLLGLGICAAFAPACTVSGAVIAAASLWLSYNGKCSNDRQLLLPLAGLESAIPPFTGYQIHCVA